MGKMRDPCIFQGAERDQKDESWKELFPTTGLGQTTKQQKTGDSGRNKKSTCQREISAYRRRHAEKPGKRKWTRPERQEHCRN